jgi:hypothetical protein
MIAREVFQYRARESNVSEAPLRFPAVAMTIASKFGVQQPSALLGYAMLVILATGERRGVGGAFDVRTHAFDSRW